MSDTLALLGELRSLLIEPLSDGAVAAMWPKVLQVEASLWGHADEDSMMRRVRSTITDVISAWNDKMPSPPVSSAAVAIGALDGHIRRRTTGADGYPIA